MRLWSKIRKKWVNDSPTSSLLWRFTSVNGLVIALFVVIAGMLLYHTACSLVADMYGVGADSVQLFTETLFYYFLLISMLVILIGAIIHFYSTKKMMQPIHQLVHSTKSLAIGKYPETLPVRSRDEIGQLTANFNELIERLQQAEQNRTQMVTDMAHELRTPLTNVNGYLEALRRNVIQGDSALYAALHQETKRLIDMVDQLYRLTEWNTGKGEPFIEATPIDAFVHECLMLFDVELAQKNMTYTHSLEPAVVYVDQHGIRQAIMNIIDNAIQYKRGGDPIRICGVRKRDSYRLCVTAKGTPIPVEHKSRLFERFYRVDASRSRHTGGSGLGLSIVKDIIETHRGQVGVDTDGTTHTFWIDLPVGHKEQ